MILLMEIIYVKKKHKIGKKSWLGEVMKREEEWERMVFAWPEKGLRGYELIRMSR